MIIGSPAEFAVIVANRSVIGESRHTVLAMTDINVSIPLGLRAASINRELAKVAVDSSALATRRIRCHRPDCSSGDGSGEDRVRLAACARRNRAMAL
jgi:hypothetical protein